MPPQQEKPKLKTKKRNKEKNSHNNSFKEFKKSDAVIALNQYLASKITEKPFKEKSLDELSAQMKIDQLKSAKDIKSFKKFVDAMKIHKINLKQTLTSIEERKQLILKAQKIQYLGVRVNKLVKDIVGAVQNNINPDRPVAVNSIIPHRHDTAQDKVKTFVANTSIIRRLSKEMPKIEAEIADIKTMTELVKDIDKVYKNNFAPPSKKSSKLVDEKNIIGPKLAQIAMNIGETTVNPIPKVKKMSHLKNKEQGKGR